MTSWLAALARFEPQIGAEYRLEIEHFGGMVVEGRVQGYDPASGMAYTFEHDLVRKAFGTTVCRWAWEPLSPDFSLVTLVHTGHGQWDAWQQAYELHVKFWTFFLGNLASVVNEGRDQRLERDPSRTR